MHSHLRSIYQRMPLYDRTFLSLKEQTFLFRIRILVVIGFANDVN